MALGWVWWRAWGPLVAQGAVALCVPGGIWRHRRCICVGGVALGDIQLRFAWQAWHLLWHWAASGGALGACWSPGRCGTLRGRRGAYGTGLGLVVRLGARWSSGAPRHFAWRAWRLATSTFVWRGRRGTW